MVQCGSVIKKSIKLEEDLSECDCSVGYALKMEGRHVELNLNGHSVECADGAPPLSSIIKVLGTNNSVKGPGTGE